jgi:CRISPR/Cas system CMR-associated protein Cmr5 small subunit
MTKSGHLKLKERERSKKNGLTPTIMFIKSKLTKSTGQLRVAQGWA